MAKLSAKILIVGESIYKIHTHFKGFASYETGYATLGLDSFISRFAGTGLDISFMGGPRLWGFAEVHPPRSVRWPSPSMRRIGLFQNING